MRFTIRDLLWATALVAVTLGIGIGWLKDRSRLIDENKEEHQFLHSATVAAERERQNYVEATETVKRDFQKWLDKMVEEINDIKSEAGQNQPSDQP